MLIAHLTDLHITDRCGDSGESLAEQIERLLWIGEDAYAAGAGALLVAGDLFDLSSTITERNAAITVVVGWAKLAPVVAVYGNHDRPGDLDFLGRLRTDKPVAIADSPEVIDVDGLTVACLPWPRKSLLAAQTDAGQDLGALALAELRGWLRRLAERLAQPHGPCVLLAHAEIGSAALDSHWREDPGQPLVGKADLELADGDLLETGADYIALGHIHRHQILGGGRLCYAGSPRQTTFGEDPLKGYCLVDVRRGEAPVIEHRRAPGRELVTVVGTWDGEAQALTTEGPDEIPADAIVRVKYHAPEDARSAAAAAVDVYAQGLGDRILKLDPRIEPTSRVRSEAIQQARTNGERLEAWWAAHGQRPKRAGAILQKLGELESEVQP